MKNIILASQSPRRQQLLKKIGLEFEVVSGDYQENFSLKLPPREMAQLFSQEKARAVAEKCPENIIIAADTLVISRGQVLGKPQTPAKAKQMLNQINGQKISSVSGVTILETPERREHTQIVETDIHMARFSETEIDNYIATGETLDKAGAFALQGVGALLIEGINGSYSNVVGLPLWETYQMLKKFNIKII